jgi:uncharacterized protein (DUF3084 family)
MPFGWRGWLGLFLAVALVLGVLQFGGAVKTWWAKRGLNQASEAIEQARASAAIARAEAAKAQAEKAQAVKEIAELKRQRDAAVQNAARERTESNRLANLAADLETKRREAPRIVTLEQARQTFRDLGYGIAP